MPLSEAGIAAARAPKPDARVFQHFRTVRAFGPRATGTTEDETTRESLLVCTLVRTLVVATAPCVRCLLQHFVWLWFLFHISHYGCVCVFYRLCSGVSLITVIGRIEIFVHRGSERCDDRCALTDALKQALRRSPASERSSEGRAPERLAPNLHLRLDRLETRYSCVL